MIKRNKMNLNKKKIKLRLKFLEKKLHSRIMRKNKFNKTYNQNKKQTKNINLLKYFLILL